MPNMPNRFSHPLRKFSGDVQDFVYNQAKSFEVDDDQTPPFSPLPSPIAHSNVNPVEIAAGICLNTSVQFDKFANLSINSLPPPPPPPPPEVTAGNDPILSQAQQQNQRHPRSRRASASFKFHACADLPDPGRARVLLQPDLRVPPGVGHRPPL